MVSCGVGADGSEELWESFGCEELKSEAVEDWAVSAAGNAKTSAIAPMTARRIEEL